MIDLIPAILPRLEAHRLPGLDLGPGFVYPNYTGGSILNVPATFCAMFDLPAIGAGPLMPEIFDPLVGDLASGIRRVIVILMDAMALHRFRAWLAEGDLPLWSELLQGGLIAPLTSIVPSTTTAALPTLWSGLSPAEHALVGYELWLQEYGVVANMIAHSSFYVDGSLAPAGFDPHTLLPGPTLGPHFSSNGVQSYAFQHYSIAGSPMSRMFLQQVETIAFGAMTEMAIDLRSLVLDRRQERQFISVYWGQVDRLSHVQGPDSEHPAAEFRAFSTVLEDLFISRLDASTRRETLLVLLADHGQIHTEMDSFYYLRTHPNLARRLTIRPTGENRLAYFNIRPGQVAAVEEYLQRTFLGQFVTLDPGYALQCGLFGPGTAHARLRERIGDLIVAATGKAYLWWSDKRNPIYGRHGGLSPEEMLIPFVAMRLG